MSWFAIHTEETVHGVYHVEAANEEEAQTMFTEEPHRVGEQVLYEAFSVEIERVEELES